MDDFQAIRAAQLATLNADFGPAGVRVFESNEGHVYASLKAPKARPLASGETLDADTPREMRALLAARYPDAAMYQTATALANLITLAVLAGLPLPDRLYVAGQVKDPDALQRARERLTNAGVDFTDVTGDNRTGLEISAGAASYRLVLFHPAGAAA
jgi:hypothetical protein